MVYSVLKVVSVVVVVVVVTVVAVVCAIKHTTLCTEEELKSEKWEGEKKGKKSDQGQSRKD